MTENRVYRNKLTVYQLEQSMVDLLRLIFDVNVSMKLDFNKNNNFGFPVFGDAGFQFWKSDIIDSS